MGPRVCQRVSACVSETQVQQGFLAHAAIVLVPENREKQCGRYEHGQLPRYTQDTHMRAQGHAHSICTRMHAFRQTDRQAGGLTGTWTDGEIQTDE